MFEIVSDIFPVINILIICIEKFTIFIKFAFAKRSVIELLFEKNNNVHKRKKMMSKNLKLNDSLKFSKDKFDISNVNKFNDIYKLNHNFKIDKINKNNTQSADIFNSGKVTKVLPNSNKSLERNNNISFNSLYSNPDIKIFRNPLNGYKKRKTRIFPLFYFFLDIFIDKLDKPKKFCCLNKKYLIVYNYICRIFNVSSYILLFKYFNIYRNILFKENKDSIWNIQKKININDEEIMENVEQNALKSNYDNEDFFYQTIMN